MCMGGEAPTHVGIVSILNQVCKMEINVQIKGVRGINFWQCSISSIHESVEPSFFPFPPI